MINIPCRNFSVKVEKNNPDGTKTPIDFSSLSAKSKINHEMIILTVVDAFTAKDDCREAKSVLEYIKNLK